MDPGKAAVKSSYTNDMLGLSRSVATQATTPSVTRNTRFAQPSRRSIKTTDSYHKWIEWSDEDGACLGKCPDLITGIHGDDPVKLYAELTELVEEVVDHFKETG